MIKVLLTLILTGCNSVGAQPVCRNFEIVHDIKWINTPTLPFDRLPALNSTPGANPYDYWAPSADINVDYPDKQATISLVENHPRKVKRFYLNIENLPNVYQASTELQQYQTAQKLTSIASWLKAEYRIEIGYYSNIIQTGYPFTTNDPVNRDKWVTRNSVFLPMSNFVDVIYLNMYTIWEDRVKWVRQLDDTMNEARKTGKPVYAFIWPRYHQGSPTAAGEMIPGDFWRLQLEEAYIKTDGVVIWTGGFYDWNDLSSDTDPNNWYYQTLDFMQSKGL